MPVPEVDLEVVPIPLPRVVDLVVPRTPRVVPLPRPVLLGAPVPLVATSRCLCSSARRLTSARRLSSSAALRSAAAALAAASLSISARSCDAPFQDGLRSKRWLCSVCESMRVHVLRRVEAVFTVFETVYIWLRRVLVSNDALGLVRRGARGAGLFYIE